jgi:antitoxin VapB
VLLGREAVMRREGERLIIEPARMGSLVEYLATLKPLDEELPAMTDSPPEPVNVWRDSFSAPT